MKNFQNDFSSDEILMLLKNSSSLSYLKGMKRFGIDTSLTKPLGVSIPKLRKIAKIIGKNHKLAIKLWNTKIHEARLLASFIDDYKCVTENQMEKWSYEFSSWDICDAVCGNFFYKTPFAIEKAKELSQRKNEFEKRAGFVLMAELAIHNKQLSDNIFIEFFLLIISESYDERNFVKKSINWSLRQIGKRNAYLKEKALLVSKELKNSNFKSARWIGSDAFRELNQYNFD
ncbi:MAG: DNA alkylation repair protein [Candidatus Parvarchaeum sp.]